MTSIVQPEVALYGTGKGSSSKGNDGTSPVLNKFSREVTQSAERGGAQAMLHGAGLSIADLDKPQIGISSVWWEGESLRSNSMHSVCHIDYDFDHI